MLSVNGRFEVRRARYAGEEASRHPIDRLLDAAEAVLSVGVRKLCCEVGIGGRSFARGVKTLKSTAQINISEEFFRQVVESEGKAVLKASAEEELEVGWSAADCKTTTPSGQEITRVQVSADGVMTPPTTQAEKEKRRETVLKKRKEMPAEKRKLLAALKAVKKGSDQRFKQVYVTSIYTQDQKHRLVGVTRKDHKGLGKLLRRDAARVHLRAAVERVGLVDGAACLRKHLECLPLEEIVLDFYHLSEHVNDAGRKTLGEASEAGKQWSEDVLHTLRHEGYEAFWKKLADWRGKLRGGKRKVADQLMHYVAQRREMIIYDICDKRGWDVGTGPMESQCGVTTDRIKGRGRRWDHENAEAVMGLEALEQSNLTEKYWDKQLCGQN